MKKTQMRFLTASFAVIIAVSVIIMVCFAYVMSKKSEDSITDIGTLYMSQMNEEITIHFQTIISLRLTQVETIVNNNPPQKQEYGDQMLEKLKNEGEIRGFSSLALLSEQGKFQMIYGEALELEDPDSFLRSLNNSEKKVAIAKNSSGESYIMLGISTVYPMADGETNTALVAAISADYVSKALSLDDYGGLTYSQIIRKDGSFVIKNVNESRDNYFKRVRDLFEETDGKTVDDYIQELSRAMENNESYSSVFVAEGERRHLYISSLPNSEWYLITIMPYGELEGIISDLGNQRIQVLLVCLIILMAVFASAFYTFYRMTQKQLEEIELARMEADRANKAKSEFLSNMSHDIRTPMNAIVGLTAIAAANIDNKQQLQNCLEKISLSNKHLLGLINDILDMSKIESGKLNLSVEVVSLRDMMDDIVNIVQPQVKTKKQKFDIYVHDIESEDVFSDGVRLNQVVLNLLSNAVKFTPEGGFIQTELYEESSKLGENYVNVNLIVTDNGIGMSPDFKEKIFESFAREDKKRVHKTEGTGLGMAITKYIVDAMGGEITVESEPGKGSKFFVSIDMEKAYEKEEDMVLPDWNMLVVDDDKQLCESAVSSLKDIGIKSDWTLDGESAVEMVVNHHKKHDDYDVILLDWQLPGIDGIETARQIRNQIGEDISIILISAYDWSDFEDEARQAGVNGFISKPLFKSTLYYGLKHFTEQPQTTLMQSHEKKRADFAGKKLLVAEDNDLNWEIICELLSQSGFETEHAENGRVCIDKFTNSPVGYYSAVLMDIRMPVMNGYEAAEGIRKLSREDNDVPIIAMTADAFSDDIKRCLDAGMNAHVAKPVDIQEVSYLLAKYIK